MLRKSSLRKARKSAGRERDTSKKHAGTKVLVIAAQAHDPFTSACDGKGSTTALRWREVEQAAC